MNLDGMRTFDRDEIVDVVVVGTGAGGAPLLARLAERGLRVVALEAGPNHDPADYTPDEVEATAIVKGLRAISDFEYESEMAQLNHKIDSGIESVYVFARPDYSFLSSTGVKEMATFGADISDLVPAPVAAALADRLERDRK